MFKTNFKNNSQALAYSVYMMVGSYFKSCKCQNEMSEDKFFISYCEAGEKLQYSYEERAEKYVLKNVFEKDADFKALCEMEDVLTNFTSMGDGFIVSFTGKGVKLLISTSLDHGRCHFNFSKSCKLKTAAPAQETCAKVRAEQAQVQEEQAQVQEAQETCAKDRAEQAPAQETQARAQETQAPAQETQASLQDAC